MAFLDKLFRWRKKPFGDGDKGDKGGRSGKGLAYRQAGDKGSKISDASATPAASAHGTGAFAHILIRPHTSEKAVSVGALSQYIFEVAPSATKHDVSQAIRDLYGVIPEAVNMLNVKGKQLRFGRTAGMTKAWKKAVVTLPAGKSLDLYKK